MKKLSVLITTLILASCGGGGVSGTKGFYRLEGSLDKSVAETSVLNVVRDEDGSVVSYEVPSDPSLFTITLSSFYEGEGTPLKMFLRKLTVSAEGVTEEIPLSGEIGDSTTVSVPLLSTFKTETSLVRANELEDKKLIFAEKKLVAKKDSIWESGNYSTTYTGGDPVTINAGGKIQNVFVRFDNVTCSVDSNGEFLPPCKGNVEGENGTITVSIDNSYLSLFHEKTVTYTGEGSSFYLSRNVVPGSVAVTNDNLGIALVDDGNGHLEGSGNGTVNYESGLITPNIDSSRLPAEEKQESFSIDYKSGGTLNLPDNLKPFSLRLEAFDSNGTVVASCTDDGNGNLVGDCSGSVDYKSGKAQYIWNGVSAESMRISYAYISYSAPLTLQWETETKTLSLTISYEKLSPSASKEFFFRIPDEYVENYSVYDNGVEVLLSDCNVEINNGFVRLTFSDYPKGDVYFNYVASRTINFNPHIEVTSLASSVTLPVTIKVEAQLETGEKLTKEFQAVVEGKTVEEEQ